MVRMALLVGIVLCLADLALAQPSEEPGRNEGMLLKRLQREPIHFELDLPYAQTENPRQRLDLFLPKERKRDKLPVIVFIHGGAWMHGHKSAGAGRLLPFVRSGEYAGVSVGYRLSGEAQWPAQLDDCKAAIRWVRANADKYGLNADHIGVWGPSAGGHLVLMLGMTGDVPEMAGELGPYDDTSTKVACVVNFFGVTEILALPGQPSVIDRTRDDIPEAHLLGGPLRENRDKAKAASPVTHITPNDPPVLTVHGDGDRIVPYDQGVRLHAALEKAGVPSYFVTIAGGGHGDFGRAADDRVRAFFAKYLLKQDVTISTDPIAR